MQGRNQRVSFLARLFSAFSGDGGSSRDRLDTNSPPSRHVHTYASGRISRSMRSNSILIGASVNGAPRRKEYAAPLRALPRLCSQRVHISVSRAVALAFLSCINALQSLCPVVGAKRTCRTRPRPVPRPHSRRVRVDQREIMAATDLCRASVCRALPT